MPPHISPVPTGTEAMVLRLATAADALTLAALRIQVFLHTYAPDGVRPDHAREVFANGTEAALQERLRLPHRAVVVAERGEGVLGFVELSMIDCTSPVAAVTGFEIMRLYVQPNQHGRGIGRSLLHGAEERAKNAGATHMWLTAWARNAHALGFYHHMGFADIGPALYVFENRKYENRVLVKRLTAT
jgi:diamine N-acetyltransferase